MRTARRRKLGRFFSSAGKAGPRLLSGVIDSTGLVLTLTFSAAVSGQSASGNADFTEDVAGSTNKLITYTSGSGTTELVYAIEIIVATPIPAGTVVYVRTKGTTGLKDAAGVRVAEDAFKLTNNSTA